MKRFYTIFAVFAVFVLGACANETQAPRGGAATAETAPAAGANAEPGTPPAGALSGAEIQQAYSGGRYYGQTPSGRVFILDYHPDGRMEGVVPRENDTGRWWVQGDQLCRRWNRWAERKPEECFFVVMTDEHARWIRNDGSLYRAWRRN